ncbi:MerR family transcriptional regulator [Planotetraspora thailandica]|uniref:MerR family transcriptional regulator n=1 Tax=Planotetraspora thailandica TaxID=487172 RepID=A0A8J3V161_9ACTN|nr:MerR family transcriptional regulator [Planotetraspora thailandica]GII52184.1 MerR family transcriptional regulator [Planotetraspora thailandica]
MDGDTILTIGDLARRTGLTVKAIRFYSDSGLVPPIGRSPGGYRLYDLGSLARLELVRTLRELGIDLPTVRRVLEREVSMSEVAAAHAEAVDVQIRILRLRRAVLRAVAERGSDPQEMKKMHKLAKLSAEERRRLIREFVDEAFGGLDANPDFVAMMRSAMPELPDDPTAEQVDAWVELAELVQDADFRASVRRMAEQQAADRAYGDTSGLHHELTEATIAAVGQAIEAGIDPASPEAVPIVDGLAVRYAQTFGRTGDDEEELRRWLLTRMEAGGDPRAERYWQLLAVINGWPVSPTLAPVFSWFTRALRATGPTTPSSPR